MSTIDKDLATLARQEWAKGAHSADVLSDGSGAYFYELPNAGKYTYPQYLHARHVLGLDDNVMTEEEEAMPAEEHRNKYMREIKPGVWVDVYSVLVAFNVTNPADAHAIKKMLMPGRRGAKDSIQDRREAIDSIERAIEIEEGRS